MQPGFQKENRSFLRPLGEVGLSMFECLCFGCRGTAPCPEECLGVGVNKC